MAETIDELLKRYQLRHAFPNIIKEISALDPDSASVVSVVEILSKDAQIAAELLSLSNSAYYGAGNVKRIEEAILMLGVVRTINILFSILIMQLMNPLSPTLNMTNFRSRSAISAVSCEVLAQFLGKNKNEQSELFLIGLIQDIGMLVFNNGSNNYSYCGHKQFRHEEMTRAEKMYFSFDHSELGAALLDRMDLPNSIVIGVLNSHKTDSTDISSNIVVLSGCVADIFISKDRRADYSRAMILAEKHLGVKPELFIKIIEQVSTEAREINKYFRIEIDLVETLETVRDYESKRIKSNN